MAYYFTLCIEIRAQIPDESTLIRMIRYLHLFGALEMFSQRRIKHGMASYLSSITGRNLVLEYIVIIMGGTWSFDCDNHRSTSHLNAINTCISKRDEIARPCGQIKVL